jgi:hypothetical protein
MKEKAEAKKLRSKALKKHEALNAIRSQLATKKGPYPQPMLSSQIGYLYSMISRVDQKLGKDAYIRYDELHQQLEELENNYKNL